MILYIDRKMINFGLVVIVVDGYASAAAATTHPISAKSVGDNNVVIAYQV